MAFINLTPHSIEVYTENAFEGLKQVNPTTLTADSVYSEQAIGVFPSKGSARISVSTTERGLLNEIPISTTVYGDAVGIPDDLEDDDILIVSLPMQSMMKASNHPLAHRAVAPYRVVRSAENGSVVLGCIGFTF